MTENGLQDVISTAASVLLCWIHISLSLDDLNMASRYSIEERRKLAAWMDVFQSPSIVQEKFKTWTERDAPSRLTIVIFSFGHKVTATAHQTAGASSTSMVAILDMNGFQGAVEFHSNPAKAPFAEVLMRVNVIGPQEGDKLTWSIWERPADLTRVEPCSVANLGKELTSFTNLYGYVRAGREMLVRDTFGILKPVNLFERTLVVKSIHYALHACALIRSSVPSRTLEAHFLSPVGGVMVIRQLPKVATGIRATMHWTSGEGGPARDAKLQWSLIKIRQDLDQVIDEAAFHQWSCSHLWELIASDRTWPLYVSTNPEASIGVGGTGDNPQATHTYIVETNFTSLEGLDLEDLWVVLQWTQDEFVACAPLLEVHPREAIAEFQQPPYVTGYVHFYQASGYGDATIITVNVSVPKRNSAGIGVDDLTRWPEASGFRHECLDLSLSFFNPLDVDLETSPLPLEGTTDRYPVGDLSGKMGSLLDQKELHKTFYNQYATLFGKNSLVGRSVVIYEDSWYPLACSNLLTGQEELVAMATFHNILDGQVVFHQRLEGPLAPDTNIHVNLRYQDQANSTKNHRWKIHSSRPSGRTSNQRRRQQQPFRRTKAPSLQTCDGSKDSIYNPYGVDISSARYACNCKPSTGVRCALGDLSGRLGTIDIYQSEESADIMGNEVASGQLFTDSGLFLSGEFSIVGLALVVYNADYDEEPLECATVQLFSDS